MKDDQFSLVAKTLAALLTEQHQISAVSKRQADSSRQQADILRQQTEILRQHGEILRQHGELIQAQGGLLQDQVGASERQAGRLEELIALMGAFAEGSTEVRQRLSDVEHRLDRLEESA